MNVKVVGLKQNTIVKTFSISKKKLEDTVYFGNKLGLKQLNIISINMDDFTNEEGVKVTLNKGDGVIKYATVYTPLNGNGIKSLEVAKFDMYCNVFVCEGGIVLLSTKKFGSEDDVNIDDVPHAFFLTYFSTKNYIAKTLPTDVKVPNAYECPKQGWIHPKSLMKFEYHPSTGPIDAKLIHHSLDHNYLYSKVYKQIFMSPLVPDKNSTIKTCNIVTMYDKSVLKWSYGLKYETNNVPESIIDFQEVNGQSLTCREAITIQNSHNYLFIAYIDNNAVGKDKRKFSYQTFIPTHFYYKSIFLVYNIYGGDDRYTNLVDAPKIPLKAVCYYKLKNIPETLKINIELETSVKLGKDIALPDYKQAKTIIVEKNAFALTSEKIIDIKCKGKTHVSKPEHQSMFKKYFDQFLTPQFVKVEGLNNIDKAVEDPSDNKVITFKEGNMDYYGLYKCIPNQREHHIPIDQADHFVILPEDGMVLKLPVRVHHQETINSWCILEYPNFAKLVQVSMEFQGKKTVTSLNELYLSDHFILNEEKKRIEFKTILRKGDIMKCSYDTVYGTRLTTSFNFDNEKELMKGKAAETVIYTDRTTFIVVAVVAFVVLIAAAVAVFLFIRIKRKRRMRSEECSLSGSLSKTSKSKKSKSSKSKSNSKSSKSNSSTSKSKKSKSASKSQIKPTVTLSAR
ncbi:Hypothetical protein SRAE_1000106400 [Strongyloides ratti]|uniref:Uncharacterized protein n=1 Tax=Strongyloides ratti TaxID=34506 RepID=A0A090KZ55_STRRB|nr:Hypothetical protein SRAE_1000106400 [Strongyloides ratti]CEF62795.1 Hypothetical protein SRAE_1000106400 [Strongyloides ratti]